ncbi:hypothetical protein DIT71_05335 [Marinobacter vulgaris]|uniref:Uncharacterized protein n=1 Tax=Marinobacter vulgaris TaxID=1928331 RepID=A0A2V3ZNE6_9GAMM|nr:hypothetical protein DIT71_05335 [Marinobacter vulgaris]TSJ71828.1 hypothetical protein FPC41_04130 [Marinobacter vulgaris]
MSCSGCRSPLDLLAITINQSGTVSADA